MLIKPYEKNAKKHDRVQIENVKESIRQFGMVQPIVVDNEGTIIIGHCRFIALLEMGYKADNLPENFFIVKDLPRNKQDEGSIPSTSNSLTK